MKIVNRASHVLEVALLPFSDTLTWTSESATGTDGGGKLSWRGRAYSIRAFWIGQGWPSEVMKYLATSTTTMKETVVTADRFAAESIKLLREKQCNYADLAGNICLKLPNVGLFLDKEGSVLPRSAGAGKRGSRNWSKAELDIAEILLYWHQSHRDGGPITLEQMDESLIPVLWGGWSKPMVSNCLRRFTQYGWMERNGPLRGKGVWWRITQPGAILEALTESRSLNSPVREEWFSVDINPSQLTGILKGNEAIEQNEWALTGWHALDYYAPLFPHSMKLQVCVWAGRWNQVREMLARDCQLVPKGEGNLEIWQEQLRLHFKREMFVNRIKLYSDLVLLGGRGPQAAEHLRAELLKI